MKAIQYTLRNVPEHTDRYFRNLAHLRGQSLNSVIINELNDKAGMPGQSLYESLKWFIGKGGIGKDAEAAIAQHRQQQRALVKREHEKLDAIMKDINSDNS